MKIKVGDTIKVKEYAILVPLNSLASIIIGIDTVGTVIKIENNNHAIIDFFIKENISIQAKIEIDFLEKVN